MKLDTIAKRVFEIESHAIQALSTQVNENFEQIVQVMGNCVGHLIWCGVGKSGLLAQQLAATFNSIGCSSFFLHPTEALHGDLGMLTGDDCFISISNSGETDELLQLLPHIRQKALPHVSFTGQPQSTLARYADWVLEIPTIQEATRLQAIPMVSTIATMAMGHALAAAIIELKEIEHHHFLTFHPGGSLGKKLVTSVEELMQSENLPVATLSSSISSLLLQMSQSKLGLAIIMQAEQIKGVVTDGDLRRALERSEQKFFNLSVQDLMTKNPKTITTTTTVLEAEELMQKYKITNLLVLKDHRLVGVIANHHIK